MALRDEILAEVFEHCDLRERLTLVPPRARVRGLYFGSIEAALAQAGQGARYRAAFPARISGIGWQPASELLVRVACGAALLGSASRVHEGMFAIGRYNPVMFAESLLGRAMLRLLARDPRRVLQQGAAARRQSYSYGAWTLTFPTERSAVMAMSEEYLYIESYLLGAAQGTFDAIGAPVRTQVVLEDRFNGRHELSW